MDLIQFEGNTDNIGDVAFGRKICKTRKVTLRYDTVLKNKISTNLS